MKTKVSRPVLAAGSTCFIVWYGMAAKAITALPHKDRGYRRQRSHGKQPKEAGVVQLKAGDIAMNTRLPLQKLCGALKADPHSTRFRVSWNVVVGSLSTSDTAIYDRKASTVRFYERGGGDEGRVYSHLRFIRVTDAILLKALDNYDHNSSDAGFAELAKYGCEQQPLP